MTGKCQIWGAVLLCAAAACGLARAWGSGAAIAITRRFKSTLTMKRRDMICVPSEEKDKTTYHFDGASYTE